ncbi:c-type cytochrome [Phaeobacter marinintestinus]|uniref:c-type cytochrome n=1 Tax=Falsiphaeobacter marinintestinus TaxID=1492905 RepID=UPI0011B49890|nr:c-type cytochrome [Phaeobacter marinintestinus]
MSQRIVNLGLMALPLAGLLAACATSEMMPTPTEGEQYYAEYCTACHDYSGEGGDLIGGQAAPDLTRISARNDGVFPRAAVLSKVDGYGHGKVSADVMPEFGKLLEGDLVPVDIDGTLTPTPRPLAALMVYLESIQVTD